MDMCATPGSMGGNYALDTLARLKPPLLVRLCMFCTADKTTHLIARAHNWFIINDHTPTRVCRILCGNTPAFSQTIYKQTSAKQPGASRAKFTSRSETRSWRHVLCAVSHSHATMQRFYATVRFCVNACVLQLCVFCVCVEMILRGGDGHTKG